MSTATAIDWMEQGLIPDAMVRAGIRRLLRERLAELCPDDCSRSAIRTQDFIDMLDRSPVALLPDKANEQHYELPAEFFAEVLGPQRKYSCCHWGEGVDDLAAAEQQALQLTCERAGLGDGMDILELGCGWGSLTLYAAARYPRARITAVSNSHSQRRHILAEAARRGLGNIEVITADMNRFDPQRRFHRIVSVEMFEHMRNYRRLFGRVRAWLEPGGRFFLHIFCHRNSPYEFADRGPGDWMSRHFFSGGIMPSDELPLHFQQDLTLLHRWRWSGRHYQRTLNAWLERMDRRRDRILPLLEQTYGKPAAATWWVRWRVFFMACAELFGYADGNEWWVSHYLFERPAV